MRTIIYIDRQLFYLLLRRQNPNGISRLGLWQAHETQVISLTHSFSCDVEQCSDVANELGLLGEVSVELSKCLELDN